MTLHVISTRQWQQWLNDSMTLRPGRIWQWHHDTVWICCILDHCLIPTMTLRADWSMTLWHCLDMTKTASCYWCFLLSGPFWIDWIRLWLHLLMLFVSLSGYGCLILSMTEPRLFWCCLCPSLYHGLDGVSFIDGDLDGLYVSARQLLWYCLWTVLDRLWLHLDTVWELTGLWGFMPWHCWIRLWPHLDTVWHCMVHWMLSLTLSWYCSGIVLDMTSFWHWPSTVYGCLFSLLSATVYDLIDGVQLLS